MTYEKSSMGMNNVQRFIFFELVWVFYNKVEGKDVNYKGGKQCTIQSYLWPHKG